MSFRLETMDQEAGDCPDMCSIDASQSIVKKNYCLGVM